MANEQPPDRLIKETLSHIEEAILFFKKFLPAHISRNLDFGTLKMEDKTFLNEAGRETYSDLVFSCNWKNSDKKVLLHFLIEHKSTPEKRPHLQIGGYLAEGYLAQVRQQREDKENGPLVPVIPLLLYHGEEAWEPGAYQDYFDLPDPSLAAYLPSFNLIMIDLSKFSDEEIMELGQCFLTSTLLVFKHKNDKGYVLANTGKIFIFVRASESPEAISRFFRVFLLYLFRALKFKKEELDQIVHDLPKITQPMFESTYDMLIREGEIKGEIKGEAIGIQKGEAIGIRKRSLETVLNAIRSLPSLGDSEVAQLAGLPEEFVSAMRDCYLKKDLTKAQQIAVGLFSDLPVFSNEEVEVIKRLVGIVWADMAK